MRIGVDLDGVIFNLMDEVLSRWNYQHGTNYKEEDIKCYYLEEITKCGMKYWNKWWENQVLTNMIEDTKPYRGAKTFLRTLHRDGHTLTVITARMACKPAVFYQTLNSLEKHKIPYDDIHFTWNKLDIVCDVYLEDMPEMVEALRAKDKKVFCPIRPWNTEITTGKYGTFHELDRMIMRRNHDLYLEGRENDRNKGNSVKVC